MVRLLIPLREDVTRQPAGAALSVDRAACVVKGVRIIGLVSENGRDYASDAVRRAIDARLYEGAKCNIDHPSQPGEMRPFTSRFGRFKGTRYEEGVGGRADLHYNPKHPLAETFLWWCENDPAAVGFSHNAGGDLEDRSGRPTVTNIAEVYSVDLVADPATTKGVFEAAMKKSLRQVIESRGGKWAKLLEDMDPAMMDAPAPAAEDTGDWKSYLTDAIAALVKDGSEESHKIASKIMKLLKNKGMADEPADEAAMESLRRQVGTLTESNKKLTGELDGYKVKETHAKKLADARRLCAEANLPDYAVTGHFLESLAAQRDEAGMKAAIEDRRVVLAGTGKPVSAPAGGGGMSFDQFVEGLNKAG